MNIVRYLPSPQFLVIVSSIAISGGLVVAAQKFTQPQSTDSSLSTVSTSQTTTSNDWMANLQAIEGTSIATTTDQSTDEATQTLLQAAASSNVTDTVARTLLVNLSAAKAQGLGSDIPTQDQLVANAVAQTQQERGAPKYTQDDLTLSSNTSADLKAYGNAVIAAIAAHPEANFPDTIYAVGTSTDNGDPARLAPLPGIAQAYGALTKALLAVPVPPTLAPLHLQIVNNLDQMTQTFGDMEVMFTDPLRGLAALDLYQALNDENTRVFISIAQQLNQNGILFNKDEPGSSWNSLISS